MHWSILLPLVLEIQIVLSVPIPDDRIVWHDHDVVDELRCEKSVTLDSEMSCQKVAASLCQTR